MPRLRQATVAIVVVLAFMAAAMPAHADEPPALKTETAQPAAPAPAQQLQVAGDPLDEHPSRPPPRPERAPVSDGAGPRITFGRTWTEPLDGGFYGRFETEYFEVKGWTITGMLLGLEGWGTEGATSGGAAIPVSVFGGLRGGPLKGAKAPVFFFTVGVGVDVVVFDRVGDADGFGLLSPFGVVTGGVEVVPGVRLLCDSRVVYRWHWTAPSNAQLQLGLTLGLNSYLWDGP